MALRLNSELNSIVLVLVVVLLTQKNLLLTSCYSVQENEVDLNDGVIPPSLRNILTDEVASYEISPEIQRQFVYYLSGFDYENRPVWVAEIGKWDIRRMVEGGVETLKEFDNMLHQAVYRGLNSTKIRSTQNETVHQLIVIGDADGFTLKQLSSVPTLKYLLEQYRKFLPAFSKAHAIYLVNTNYAAESFLHLIRPILGEEYEKIHVFGTNKAKWLPTILKHIPRTQIPEWYGGDQDFTPYQVYG